MVYRPGKQVDETMTTSREKLEGIINNATDDVTVFFEEHYIPGVTKEQYELAKAKMR